MKSFARNSVVGILMWAVLGYAAELSVALALRVRELERFALLLRFMVAVPMTLNLVSLRRRAKPQRGRDDNAL
jgi:hypothetical protein